MSKLKFWICADDVTEKDFLFALNRKFKENKNYILEHTNLEFFYQPLRDVINKEGTPDYVILDCGVITILNGKEEGHKVLKRFCDNHSSSVIVITSTCYPLAHQTIDEMKEYVGDEVVIEDLHGGPEWACKYVVEKVLKYYPYE